MNIKKTTLVCGLISTIVCCGMNETKNNKVSSAITNSAYSSADKFELVQIVRTISNEVLTTETAFNDYEYYNDDTYVLLHDSYSGYYNGPVASEIQTVKKYGKNNEYSVRAGELYALYKNPYKRYTHLLDGEDLVNETYSSIGLNLQDNFSSSISETISAKIGAGIGGFAEAGISSTLSFEFGMEVGSSLGATFTFTNSFKSSNKIFGYDLYEVHSNFLVVKMIPTINLLQSTYIEHWGPFNWFTREVSYYSGYSIEYKKEIYLFDTVSEIAFNYDVWNNRKGGSYEMY